MFFLCRLWIWCKRFRHRCGYGVHSPSDFFLITSIIYERSPYYAYRTLKKRGFSNYLPHYRRKVNRLLFRLVNYFRPKSLIEVGIGNGASISYMRAASRTMDSVTLKGRDRDKTLLQLTKKLEELKSVDCLHIAHTPFYQEVFEEALSYVQPDSWFIIGGIYESQEKRKWWKEVVADERVGITFDLYDIGLVFFNKNRYNKRILAARTENPTDADVIFHAYDKYSEECNYVKNVLLGNDKQAAMIGNVPYGDTACLFRTNRSVEKFAGKLIDSEIPFYSLEPLRNMLDHFVAKQIMAYFEVAMGNEKNLYEILNRPMRYVEKRYVKPSTTLAQLKSIYANADSDKSYVYENLLKLEEDLHILKELGTPSKMIQYIFSEEGINYKKHLSNCSKIMHMTEEDIDDLKETTNQLYIFFRKYDTMDNLKKGIEQYTRMIQDAYKNQDRVGKVALTTIHSSKGLEYQRVIIFDVNEENLPYRKVDEKTDIEEERRLMYVAITRAKDQVIILYNNKNASQFVSQSQLAKADFKVGDMILHKAFGKGRIVNTDSKYIQIEFPEKNRTMKFNFEYAITKNIIKKL